MAQMDVKPCRALPDGGVYRQIFDAEVSLSNTLEKERKPQTLKRTLTLPLVHDSRAETRDGILNPRQKTWTQGKPNESKIENPVFYKHATQDYLERTTKTKSEMAAKEVKGLSTKVTGADKPKSNIIERIESSRKERHDAALEDMYQELGVISSELEPVIKETCEVLKALLQENDKEIDSLLKRIESDEDLIEYSVEELQLLWEKIEAQSHIRREWIEQMNFTLRKIEEDRIAMVRETLRSYDKSLERIAHMMPPDVHRLLEKESLTINSTVLANRKAYANLVAHLLTADVEKEKENHTHLLKRVEDWRNLQCTVAIKKFGEFMLSKPVTNPPGVIQQLARMVAEQKVVNKRRVDLIQSLFEMHPPASTKASLYNWNGLLAKAIEELNTVHTKYKKALEVEYDKVIQYCMDEANRVKDKFLSQNILDEDRLIEMMNEYFLPLIGERQTKFEHEMEKMERSLDNIENLQGMQSRQLFKFAQGIAHVWDSHEEGLAKQERTLQDNLEKNRHSHDAANQTKEANLDVVMDKMRQESTEQGLKLILNQALSLLGDIKDGYREFHCLQVKTTRAYPGMVEDELVQYQNQLNEYFLVTKDLEKTPGRKTYKDGPVDQVTLEDGTVVYVMEDTTIDTFPKTAASVTSMKTQMTFVTETVDAADPLQPPYITSIDIPDQTFVNIKRNIRLQFLEHLDKWKVEAVERAKSVVAAKLEELNSELDLRIHLHGPRAARTEQDVHNVRAAELLMHRERVQKHCQGVLATLADFKSRFQEMITEHDKETDIFRNSVLELEATFTNATKTHKLLAIQDQVGGRIDEYMGVIRTSLRKFRQDLDDMLCQLRNSNARFRKTFKIFSDGGNFSSEEVDEYRKKLERMANKIDSTEGAIMGELEGMESKRLEAAKEYAGKLEDRFKHHLFDLTYIEKITRWLTNTQVKIKSEVNYSNSQAKKLAGYLATFERQIDAVEKPNLDKEQVTVHDVQESLMPVLDAFRDRAVFLNCLIHDSQNTLTMLKTGTNPRVAFTRDSAQSPEAKTSSKSILKKSSKGKLQKKRTVGSASSEDSQGKSSTSLKSSSRSLAPKTAAGGVRPSGQALSGAGADSRPKTFPGMTRIASGEGTRKASPKLHLPHIKFDRKYLVFGEKDKEGSHFLVKINNVLRVGLEGLLVTSEMYYRQKGQRSVTRPQAILENFEVCAESLIQRLQNYRKQAEEYHNSCIQELRGQLTKFSQTSTHLPPLVIDVAVQKHLTDVRKQRDVMQKDFVQQVEGWEQRKKTNQNQLRPSLGHPHNQDELQELCKTEEQRKDEAHAETLAHTKKLQSAEEVFATDFVEGLTEVFEYMLLQFDAILTTDDVETGRIDPVPKTSKELIKETMNTKDESRDIISELSSGNGFWDGLPINELVAVKTSEQTERMPGIKTTKTTPAHVALQKARDNAYEKYKSQFFTRLSEIKVLESNQLRSEERWNESWERSVRKIQQLY